MDDAQKGEFINIMSNSCNLKRYNLGLFYIPETSDSAAECFQTSADFSKSTSTQFGHWVCTGIDNI
jgi:hypothetical protein